MPRLAAATGADAASPQGKRAEILYIYLRMMITLLRTSKQQNLRPISMSAKSKYFAKLRSEVLRVKSDEASSKKSYRHARVGDLQKGPGMPAKRWHKGRVNVQALVPHMLCSELVQ